MRDWGLENVFRRAPLAEAAVKHHLSKLAKKLKWQKKYEPTTKQLADATNSQEYYNVLCHASSRTVHFSPSELLRRAWGRDANVTISSKHFNAYWTAFALSWSFDIFVHLFADLVDLLPKEQDSDLLGERYLQLIKNVYSIGRVPILTSAELNLTPPQAAKPRRPGEPT